MTAILEMKTISDSPLFTPVNLGPMHLKHRVVMAPLTRSRSIQPDSVPGSLMAEYYTQRASDGGFIITEATNISRSSRGWLGAPGLYSVDQVIGWKRITAGVYAEGGHMFAQLWHAGRSSHKEMTGGELPVSASVNPEYWENPKNLVSTVSGWVQPSPHRALTISEIAEIVEDYRRSALRAMDAGFEGVELHAANGYLPDQFLQDNSNHRTDEYGGSITNRARFLLEVVEALHSVWGDGRVAVRIAPGGTFNGMADSNPTALFTHVADRLNRFNLAYLHIIEPRVRGNILVREGEGTIATEQLRKLFSGRIISAGGFEPESANAAIQSGTADAVAFGRYFISNPDLPLRLREGLTLTPYHRETFYTFDALGYTDYPSYESSASRAVTRDLGQLISK